MARHVPALRLNLLGDIVWQMNGDLQAPFSAH
jgi:hypothetical protein